MRSVFSTDLGKKTAARGMSLQPKVEVKNTESASSQWRKKKSTISEASSWGEGNGSKRGCGGRGVNVTNAGCWNLQAGFLKKWEGVFSCFQRPEEWDHVKGRHIQREGKG